VHIHPAACCHQHLGLFVPWLQGSTADGLPVAPALHLVQVDTHITPLRAVISILAEDPCFSGMLEQHC
jgi:hypothetical protein